MKKLEAKPTEFECLLSEVPAGSMFVHTLSQEVGVKTHQVERNDDQKQECICIASPNLAHIGQMFLAGTTSFAERDALSVVIVKLEWSNV